MDERAILLVVVVVGVVGLSASAASIGDSRDTRSVGTGTTASDGVGEGEAEGMGSGPQPSIGSAAGTENPDLGGLGQLLGVIALLLVVVPLLISLVLYGRETVIEFVRSVLQTTTGVLASVLFLGVIVYLLSLFDGEGAGEYVSGALEGGGSGSSFGSALSVSSGTVPLVVVALGGLVLLVVVALLVLRSTSSPSLDSPDTEPVAGDSELELDSAREAPGGRTDEAGFADVDASNPVYRAWREMAEAADGASLRTHTPGEVARRAVDAGMDRDAVRTLTQVFDEVRYGPAGIDEESERRARSALDAITEGEET